MAQSIDLLLKASWVIPVEPTGQTLLQHAVAIQGGQILAVLPSEEADQRYLATEVIDLMDHVLMPGLINAHTHAAMSLMRGMADDLPLMDWLNEHIWPTESRYVSSAFVRDGTDLAIAEFIRGGVTCFNDMYFFPEAAAESARDAGIRAVLGLIVLEFPSAWASDAKEYLAKGLALQAQLAGDDLVCCALAPHAPYTVALETLRKVRQLAEQYDLPVHIHVHETASEVEQFFQQNGHRPLARLDQLGLLSPRLAAVHMTQLLPAEIERIAQAGVNVLHCPESNLKLASGFCPVAELVAAGVNVAIGTDGAASNNDLDMFGELRTAALLGKAVAGDAAVLPAYEVLRMATLGGAKALGLAARTGSLVAGKAADLIAVNLGVLETQPIYQPASHLAYAANRRQVSDVWVAGRRLLDTGRLTTLDYDDLVARAQYWGRQIAG